MIRNKAPKPGVVRSHRFALNARVVAHVSGRPDATIFRITRLLPESAAGFQYRIKSEKDSHERVVAESDLVAGPRSLM